MDTLEKLRALMQQRNWSEYQLARRSGVPQSTINSMFRKNNAPSLYTLEMLCSAFGLTLAEFFDGSAAQPEQEILSYWKGLTPEQQALMLELLRQMK